MSATVQTPKRARWEGVPRSSLANRLLDLLVGLAGMALLLAVATVPLQAREQAILAVVALVVFVIADQFKSRAVSVFLVMLSLAVSLRYIFWRVTETLEFSNFFALALGVGLAMAEVYAIIVLVLGYLQTLWPLERRPTPLPDDVANWPTVDVFIPTYNEPMSIVRATVLGAMAMDWPRDKMRVYLLDDGRREEFRQFAVECGIGYITRTDNKHAKAGNLNNALAQTDGEFICIFDSDHIATRAFLQMTMGWLVREQRIALVQTPHHFYSPDPFQRNLTAGTRVPAEGNMFYGLVQDGNDYWNATFFCGSCAVLRRAALEEIGGFAVETVTEDAHTMLKLHRRGWDSAYIKLPLAAGLATERLILHIGQRVRWARGMIQIFRTDNPLFGKGLTFGQRFCYLQAMIHFLFALPRTVFLTAPLAYLLMNQNIISASPLAITAYALPHVILSIATNSRLQQNWRHSFWSEIYETVLALFLVRVTVVTIFAPRRGKFNVTNKGGILANGYFDIGAVYPNLILAFFLIAGLIRGLIGLIFFENESLIFQALLLNTIWAFLSLLIVMAALAVGREARQIRSRARVRAVEPVTIYLPDGRSVPGQTRDMSQGGCSLVAERPANVPDGVLGQLEFVVGGQPQVIPSRIIRWDRSVMQVTFQPSTLAEESAVVNSVFGRADAWTDWSAYPRDRPLASLYRVLVSIRGLFRPPDKSPALPPRQPGQGSPTVAGPSGVAQVAGTAAVLLLMLLAPRLAMAQGQGGFTIRPLPGNVSPLQQSQTRQGPAPATAPAVPPPPSPASVPPPPTGLLTPQPAPQGPVSLPPAGPPVSPASVSPGGQQPAPSAPGARSLTRRLVLTLHQLGALGPLQLRGSSELQGVQFGIRADEVVTAAELNINGAMSPALIPEFSNVTVTLNEQYIGTIPANRDQPRIENLVMPVSPVFFQDNNRLNFRFTGRYTVECNDPLSPLLWSTISDTSTLTLTLERLPPQRDLSRLPLPFFDAHEKQLLTLPFIMTANPTNEALQAAAIAASWFGQLADFRGASFPVSNDAPGDGNAVVIAVGRDAPAGLGLPTINGPTLGIIPNPNDPQNSLLVIAGRTGEEVVTAATTLGVGSRGLGGDVSTVALPSIPPRVAYDAPAWIPTDRPVRFGELVDAQDLQGTGYVPGTMQVPFKTAPDLYTWRNRAFPMEIRFRAPPGPIVDLAFSRLDVGINNLYLATFPLADEPSRRNSIFSRVLDFGVTQPTSRVDVPVYDVFGQNVIQLFFDTRPLHRGDCIATPNDLRMSVDPDSTIDLSKGYRFAQLPNLAFFVNSGFPFTKMADFSETAAILPERPTTQEIGAFLNLMGRMGSITGYPVIRLKVVRPAQANMVADRDLLLMGTLQRLGDAGELLRRSPYRISGNTLTVEVADTLDSVRRVFGDAAEQEDRRRATATLSGGLSEGSAAMVGTESPLTSGRSLVAILAASPQGVQRAVSTFRDVDQAQLLQGDLSILSGDHVTSYRVGTTYTAGRLPPWVYPSWLLRDQPLLVLGVMLVGCVLMAIFFFWVLRRRAAARAGSR